MRYFPFPSSRHGRMEMNKKRRTKYKCQRCGLCCTNIGRTFYCHSEHPLLKEILEDMAIFSDTGPCSMFRQEKGKAICLIHKYLGRAAKPEACRDYPFDGEKCFYEEKKQRT